MNLQILPKYRSVFAAGSLIGLVFLNIYINLKTEINPTNGGIANTQPDEGKLVLNNNERFKNAIEYLIEAGEKQIVPKPDTPLFPLEELKKIVNPSTIPVEKVLPTLNMIMNDSQRPMALVNGKFVGVGQKIDSGDTVVSIEDESIILTDEKNKKFVVKLKNIFKETQSIKE